MKAKKSLGQNFLIDNNVINKIINDVFACENDLIIEIGPGRGALTKKLRDKNSYLLAFELDTDLKPILSNLENEKVKIIYKDFLKTDLCYEIKNYNYNKLFIVGNLPYYITTPIVEHVVDSNLCFEKFIIMVQKEVADRFMAVPGNKDYGYFTLYLKYYFEINKVVDAPRNCFNPAPKVDSTVIELITRKDKPQINILKYFEFLKKAFSQKRKTLKNNLKDYDWSKIKEVLDKYNYTETIRAEEISESIFIEIFKIINN